MTEESSWQQKLESAFSICNLCLRAKNDDDIEDIWLKTQELCCIDGLMMVASETDSVALAANSAEPRIRCLGIADEWADLYREKQFVLVDPIVSMALSLDSNTVFSWQVAKDAATEDSNKTAEFHRLSSFYGLNEGYTVAVINSHFGNISHSTSINYEPKNLTGYDHKIIKKILPFINAIQSRPGFLSSPDFTKKQKEVLLWVAAGKSNKQVGMILGMAEVTVKWHLKLIFEKLGVKSRLEAVNKGLLYGVVSHREVALIKGR